jgi:hypothetical protein
LRGLRRFFDTTYERVEASKPPLSCLLVNTSIEIGARDAKTAALLAQGRRMIRAALSETLARAQREGSLHKAANLEALADALHLGLQGLLVANKLESDKATLKRLTDSLFSILPLTAARTSEG